MLPSNLISGLKALSNTGKPLIEPSSDTTKLALKLTPGLKIQATVLAQVGEGLFNVKIAGQAIQMRLPSNVRSGEIIKLEVMTTRPRVTFNMVPSTNPLANPEKIGATARILSNLAELPEEMQTVRQLGSTAVWHSEQPVPDAKLLASELRAALGKTGLFYESHQAQWVRGERSIDQLLNEPQNLLTEKNVSSSLSQLANLNLSGVGNTYQENLHDGFSPSSETNPDQFSTNDKNNSLPVAKELLNLVQHQLHTLEHHQLTWSGQIWPEQNMQWMIQGEPEHLDGNENEQQWSTEIELTLPHLGDISARLLFTTGGLRLTLHAVDGKTIDKLNRSLPQLDNALTDANIKLVSALIES
jgi:hypothetical protein